MGTRDNKRRWLLWVVLLATAAAAAHAGAQEQDTPEQEPEQAASQVQQQQLQLQQQQLLQQQRQTQLLQQQLQQLQQQQQEQQEQQARNAASAKGLSVAYQECLKQASGMYDKERCIERERRLQDERLARTYDRVRTRLSGSNRSKLMDAQYAWEQSQAQTDDLNKALKGRGQAASLQNAEAALERVSARATELEQYAR